MGKEVQCAITINGDPQRGKALLESNEIILRTGERRFAIPLKKVTALRVVDGSLRVTWDANDASLELGPAIAARWLDQIRNPKGRIEKIGIKSGQRVSVLRVADDALLAELAACHADVSNRVRMSSDVIFFGATKNADLERLATLKRALAPNGALWVIRPKGTEAITEAAVLAAGKEAGLVDVKVVRFSETHTAEKLVIPVASRG